MRNPYDLLDLAIGVEKDSVLFAESLMQMFPHAKELELVLQEEKKHLRKLTSRKIDLTLRDAPL